MFHTPGNGWASSRLEVFLKTSIPSSYFWSWVHDQATGFTKWAHTDQKSVLTLGRNESCQMPWKPLVPCLVISDSLWPFGLQPTRLLCPWDFSAGIGCHFLFQEIFLTSGLNLQLLCLLHCMQTLDPLSYWGGPTASSLLCHLPSQVCSEQGEPMASPPLEQVHICWTCRHQVNGWSSWETELY